MGQINENFGITKKNSSINNQRHNNVNYYRLDNQMLFK